MRTMVVIATVPAGWLLMIFSLVIAGIPYVRKNVSWKEHVRPRHPSPILRKYSLILFGAGIGTLGVGEILRWLWFE